MLEKHRVKYLGVKDQDGMTYSRLFQKKKEDMHGKGGQMSPVQLQRGMVLFASQKLRNDQEYRGLGYGHRELGNRGSRSALVGAVWTIKCAGRHCQWM